MSAKFMRPGIKKIFSREREGERERGREGERERK
jgi:hypothetical protein